MADHEPSFAGNSQGDNPDVTLKVTDEQLAASFQRAKETIRSFQSRKHCFPSKRHR